MNKIEGFPRGWFVVGWSSELTDSNILNLHYFGQHMIAFRDADGVLAILDAYCPHLGAHLGVGGCKVDGTVKCPFHAWRFDRTGTCVDIPYKKKKIPARARVKPWPAVEKNGVLFMWHHPTGAPPDYEVPEIEAFGAGGWSPWDENLITVKTHPREIIENVADSAHFPVVHATHVTHFENTFEGHKATQHTMGNAFPEGREDKIDIFSTYHGPAFQISHMKGYLDSILFLAHTPITENELHLRFAVSLESTGPKTESFAKMYAANIRNGFHEDITIWETKTYRERPRLCDVDGPLGPLRKWYAQFYDNEGGHVGS